MLDRLPFFIVVAEVLSGLDVTPTFTFELRDGTRRRQTFEPITVAEHIARFGGWWQPTIRPGRQRCTSAFATSSTA